MGFAEFACVSPDKLSTEMSVKTKQSLLEDLNISGMVKNWKLSRTISEERLEKIQDIFRIYLQKSTVGLKE